MIFQLSFKATQKLFYFQVVFADLGFISDDFAIVADEAGVEVEDDVDEEEDVHDGVEDKHCDVCRVA